MFYVIFSFVQFNEFNKKIQIRKTQIKPVRDQEKDQKFN